MVKSWRARLEGDGKTSQLGPIPPRMERKHGPGTMVVPNGPEVEAMVACIPERRIATSIDLAEAIALSHNTTIACPATTSIYMWIVAHASEESPSPLGEIPFWRALKVNAELNENYPGGIERQRVQLEAEGHAIVQKGRRFYVVDYQKALINPAELVQRSPS
ncbi:MAG: 6-O-methylguanine DNA methyltransferase [Thermomicrobiales bacterium]